jgi:hypothetical protein
MYEGLQAQEQVLRAWHRRPPANVPEDPTHEENWEGSRVSRLSYWHTPKITGLYGLYVVMNEAVKVIFTIYCYRYMESFCVVW